MLSPVSKHYESSKTNFFSVNNLLQAFESKQKGQEPKLDHQFLQDLKVHLNNLLKLLENNKVYNNEKKKIQNLVI